MKRLFTSEQLKTIETKVAQIELECSGEVAVVTRMRSAGYDWLPFFLSLQGIVIASGAAYIAQHFSYFPLNLLSFFCFQCAGAAFGFLLSRSEYVLRWVVPRKTRRALVQQNAWLVFHEMGIRNTRDHNGVLVYVSEAEREICVLGDENIHRIVGQTFWEAMVQKISVGVGKQQPLEAVLNVLDEIAAPLKKHFPPRSDDVNELPDVTS